jgi:hypothetical protein
MKEREVFIALILVVLMVWLSLRTPSQTIIVLIRMERQPEVEQVHACKMFSGSVVRFKWTSLGRSRVCSATPQSLAGRCP